LGLEAMMTQIIVEQRGEFRLVFHNGDAFGHWMIYCNFRPFAYD
jgi:hypothetical protein